MIKLKPIEWKIYNYIKESSLQNKWLHQVEIVDYMLEKYGIKVNSRSLRQYIQNIRNCDKIQNIILTDFKKGYKLMSDLEQQSYLENRKISILKMLKKHNKDVKRLSADNQLYIKFGKYERGEFEALIEVN